MILIVFIRNLLGRKGMDILNILRLRIIRSFPEISNEELDIRLSIAKRYLNNLAIRYCLN